MEKDLAKNLEETIFQTIEIFIAGSVGALVGYNLDLVKEYKYHWGAWLGFATILLLMFIGIFFIKLWNRKNK